MQTHFYHILLFFSLSLSALATPQDAQYAFNHGQFERAIQLWQHQLAQQASPKLYIKIARAYVEMGLSQSANEALDTARGMIDENDVAILAYWRLVRSQVHATHDHNQDPTLARKHLEEALKLREQIDDPLLVAEMLNHAANLQVIGLNHSSAQQTYQEALKLLEGVENSKTLRNKIHLNHARTVVEDQLFLAGSKEHIDTFKDSLEHLQHSAKVLSQHKHPHGRVFAYLQVHDLARRVHGRLHTSDAELVQFIDQTLEQAIRLAGQSQDSNAKGHTHASASRWYFEQGQLDKALQHIRRALFFNAHGGSQWATPQWLHLQGQILHSKKQPQAALAVYRQAVEKLNPLRHKVANTGYRPPAGFREQIAPVYLDLADLLLLQAKQKEGEAQQTLLKEAQQSIEHLKQVELQDYFRSPCIAARSDCRALEQALDTHTAVLYPVMLPDRLELLLSLRESILHVQVPVTASQVQDTVALFAAPLRRPPRLVTRGSRKPRKSSGFCAPLKLKPTERAVLKSQRPAFLDDAQQLYQWLIKPLEPHLQNNDIKQLIIVPDGILRTLPFAALHDGQHYLIERYAIGISPGLCLAGGKNRQGMGNINMLLGGVSKQVQGFSAIPCAKYELKKLRRGFAQQQPLFLDEQFRLPLFQKQIGKQAYSVVHIASHGKFEEQAENSFILTYDSKLTFNRLQELSLTEPLDLLTLSACETAKGNDRAALGLAGVALKMNARSVLATLWEINDNATPALLLEFYHYLQKTEFNKIQALQQAQIYLLQQDYLRYRHPYYWSAFVMVGDWH